MSREGLTENLTFELDLEPARLFFVMEGQVQRPRGGSGPGLERLEKRPVWLDLSERMIVGGEVLVNGE